MKKWNFALALVIATGILWRFGQPDFSLKKAKPEPASVVEVNTVTISDLPDFKEDLSAEHLIDYGSEETTALKDLELVRDALEVFLYSVKIPGALPTSGNREIVRALCGDNAYRIRIVNPISVYFNETGEIVDRWGSPLYFHFEDASDPGLRSAGPDQKMWTSDDISYGENQAE